jgi:RNA polymerase sigma factor (sigma-70 family)
VELTEHFFRREVGPLVAALTRIFGVRNLVLAEDVVQDAFCRAVEVWRVRGVPENPSAWLMATAKNRALDRIRRERTAVTFAPDLSRHLESEWTLAPAVDAAFEAASIRDGQLRMMFSCCHPKLPEQAQLALILNVLCGFGAPEIAAAFLTGRQAIEKRISRGKEALSAARNLFDLATGDIEARFICCSARGTTARRPTRRCTRTCATKRSGWSSCSERTRPRRRRQRTRSLPSCTCTRPGCRQSSTRRAI